MHLLLAFLFRPSYQQNSETRRRSELRWRQKNDRRQQFSPKRKGRVREKGRRLTGVGVGWLRWGLLAEGNVFVDVSLQSTPPSFYRNSVTIAQEKLFQIVSFFSLNDQRFFFSVLYTMINSNWNHTSIFSKTKKIIIRNH